MIILDTHVWVWWVHGDASLPAEYARTVALHESDGLGISAISCWEVAKLVEYGRLTLPCTINDWMTEALAYPGIRLLELLPQIAVESTRLPPPFHKDPADQIIVATARVHDCELLTLDHKIRSYPDVKLVPLAPPNSPHS
ncbi:MAG: type II toxin-antitoxin system VapC family toxin [Acidobacteriota bacterium]